MYTLRHRLFFYSILGSLLLLTGCQPTPSTEPTAPDTPQTTERRALEAEYDQLILNQRNTPTAPLSIASLSPQQAQELLETAKILYNIDSNRFGLVDSSMMTRPPHQDGGLLFTVRDYDQAYANVQTLANQTGIRLISETEQTTDHHRGIILQLETPTQQLDQTVERLEGLATVLRKKQRWQPATNNHHLSVKSQLVVHQQRLSDLSEQLETTEPLADQLLIKDNIAQLSQEVEHTVLQLQDQATAPQRSILTVAFYEATPPPPPAPQHFSADFSNNLKAGWAQFKGFLLQAALVWPYIVLGILALIILGLIVGNSRRKTRQFQLQLLHKQQPVVQPVVVPTPPQV